MIKKFLAGVLLASVAATALIPAAASAAPGTTIVDKLVALQSNDTYNFGTLITAATCPDLGSAVTDLLSEPDKTLFAPTDAAFRRLGEALGVAGGLISSNVCSVDSLLGSGTLLTILAYHVVDAKVPAKTAAGLVGKKVEMVSGEKAAITLRGGQLRIADAAIKAVDIRASNTGIIHVIKSVMVPPSLR